MSRNPEPCEANAPPRRRRGSSFDIQVITPMFGGGTEAGTSDPCTIIRPSSIRGHLRFWWRATRGAHYATFQELHAAEEAVWGTVDKPSSVRVHVEVTNPGKSEVCAEAPAQGGMPMPRDGYPGYAIFPFQGTRDERPRHARVNVKFRLFVEHQEEHTKDVGASLWAWLNFGGIGARTRRGCGALYCATFAPQKVTPLDLKSWAVQKIREFALELPQQARPWPKLWGLPITSQATESPMAAWKHAVELLKTYRQGEGVGRNVGARNRPGRSRWPEADSLRQLTKLGDPRHLPSQTINERAFPRAEFGLPIIFHFKDVADSANNCELYPRDKNRMASPIILKPLAYGNGTQAVAMLLRLVVEPVKELEIRKGAVAPKLGEADIRRPDLATYSNSPLQGSSSGSAVDGFLRFARKAL